jgi:hypothetical protein
MRPLQRLLLARRNFFTEPTPSFQHGFRQAIGTRVLGTGEQGNQLFNTGRNSRIIVCAPGDDIQAAIDKLHVFGGGTVVIRSGTHNVRYNIVVYSNIALIGDNVGSTIDFGGGAYQIQILGGSAYSTGTVALASGDTTVVGTGTTFTAAMVSRSILLQDLWYEVTAVTDATHLTIGVPYAGTDLTSASYVIADTVTAVQLSGITLQNSSIFPIKAQYFDDFVANDVFFTDCAGCIDADDSSGLQILGCFTQNTDDGFDLSNCQYGVIFNGGTFNVSAGDGLRMAGCGNWMLLALSYQGIAGRAAAFTQTTNFAFESSSIKSCGGIGIEFVSANDKWALTDCAVESCVSDGVKLTASTNGLAIHGTDFANNGGYGVNIANANCNGSMVFGNTFTSNTSGRVNDLGTGTLMADPTHNYFN